MECQTHQNHVNVCYGSCGRPLSMTFRGQAQSIHQITQTSTACHPYLKPMLNYPNSNVPTLILPKSHQFLDNELYQFI